MSKNGQTAAVLVQDPEKLERVQRELEHLREIFKDVNENKRDFVQRQIEQLAWFNVSIADLQEKVDRWGTLIQYDNGGNQQGVRTNPDVKTLLDYQKSCNTIVRTLISLVPEKQIKGGKLAWLRSQQELVDDLLLDDDEELEEKAKRDREYEERHKKAEEDFKRAVEQQRREREQREQEKHGKT